MEQTVEKVRKELEEIAKELSLKVENPKVIVEWGKRGGWYNDEIAENLILPLYFPEPKFKIMKDEKGCPLAKESD